MAIMDAWTFNVGKKKVAEVGRVCQKGDELHYPGAREGAVGTIITVGEDNIEVVDEYQNRERTVPVKVKGGEINGLTGIVTEIQVGPFRIERRVKNG